MPSVMASALCIVARLVPLPPRPCDHHGASVQSLDGGTGASPPPAPPRASFTSARCSHRRCHRRLRCALPRPRLPSPSGDFPQLPFVKGAVTPPPRGIPLLT